MEDEGRDLRKQEILAKLERGGRKKDLKRIENLNIFFALYIPDQHRLLCVA
jgi:hypothetical protein